MTGLALRAFRRLAAADRVRWDVVVGRSNPRRREIAEVSPPMNNFPTLTFLDFLLLIILLNLLELRQSLI